MEFRGLDFAYGETAVLRDVRFGVPAGRLVGVTGPTASGKTTLLRLLTGLYPLPPGRLLVGGEDLAGLDGDTHRRSLAVVLQEGRLFSGTVGENLLYAVPEAGGDLLRQVTEKVRLEEEVDTFSEGFDTRVGEGGLTLSGGQRQRVGLGRALARGGSLWLLDDPFSHLDAATARADLGGSEAAARRQNGFPRLGEGLPPLGGGPHPRPGAGTAQGGGDPRGAAGPGGLYARLARREKLRDELEGLG